LIEIYSKDPDKRVSFTHLPEGDSITAFDGHERVVGAPKGPVRDMHGPDIDGASIDADLHFPAHLKEMFSKVETRGSEKIGDHDCYLVVGEREGKPPLRLYLMSNRVCWYGWCDLERVPGTAADANRLCGLWRSGRSENSISLDAGAAGRRFTIQVSDVKQNVPVDDAKFAKPPAPPEDKKVRRSEPAALMAVTSVIFVRVIFVRAIFGSRTFDRPRERENGKIRLRFGREIEMRIMTRRRCYWFSGWRRS